METIILASGSPRRSEILHRLCLPFRVVKPEIREEDYYRSRVTDMVMLLAQKKVEAVQKKLPASARKWILGVDTVVMWKGKAFGKPENKQEAGEMLRKISGKVHKVVSGIVLFPGDGRPYCRKAVISTVKFYKLTSRDIDYYLGTGEWQGVAGGYRIQERASFFIQWIKGSYSNIVGLPISDFYGMLRQNNYSFEGFSID